MLLAKVGIVPFFRMIYQSGSQVSLLENGTFDVRLKGVANFLYALELDKLLDKIPIGSVVIIDMSHTRLVDLSIMENMIEFKPCRLTKSYDLIQNSLKIHSIKTKLRRKSKVK